LLAQAAAVEKGLILKQKDIDAAEKLRLSQDKLNDAWQAMAITLGTSLTPALTGLVDGVNISNEAQQRMIEKYGAVMIGSQQYAEMLAIVTKEYEDNRKAVDVATEGLDEYGLSQQAILDANMQMISTVQSLQSAEDSYTQKSNELAGQRAEAEANLALLRSQGYSEYSTQIQDQIGKLDEIKGKESELEIERDRQNKQFLLGMLQQTLAVDGLTTAELDGLLKQGVAWGIYSEKVAAEAQAAIDKVNGIANAINAIPANKTSTITVMTNYNYASNNTAGGTDGDPATPRASGGFTRGRTLVGEHGPEIVDLPGGSYVNNSSQSREMMTGGSDPALLDALAANNAMMQALPDMIARAMRGNERYAR
jgi:hypothetical protein